MSFSPSGVRAARLAMITGFSAADEQLRDLGHGAASRPPAASAR